MATFIRRHPLLAYYVLTFVLSWGGFVLVVGPSSLVNANWQAEENFLSAIMVMLAGPSMDSSFHIVGTIFDSVIKEGVHLDRGNVGNYGSQAVDLSPAQGAIIEMHFDEDGLYPIVTHAFNFVGRGALGLFQAGDGDPAN